jgi:hypothetical protein
VTRLSAIVTALALAACAAPSPSSAPPATPTIRPTASAGAPQSATDEPETAADLLECDGEVSATGGRADEFGPNGGGVTPNAAFDAFLASPIFPIPLSGYAELGSVGDRAVYGFEHDGELKVVIVVSRRFGEMVGTPFTVEELRMCELEELGPADFGPGRRVWISEATGRIVTDIQGPEHCEWQSARMLHVEEDGVLIGQYLRDPEGVFGNAGLLETYDEGVELPDDATDSGYRSPEGFELWFTASDRAAYVVTPDGVERWPRAEEPIGCA